MDITQQLASAVMRDIAEAMQAGVQGSEAFWRLMEAEVHAQIKASEHAMAQLWLSGDGKHTVCVDIHGCDEPLVVPFFVPSITLPHRAEFSAQVEESRSAIRACRLLAKELTEMADAAEAALAEMGITAHD